VRSISLRSLSRSLACAPVLAALCVGCSGAAARDPDAGGQDAPAPAIDAPPDAPLPIELPPWERLETAPVIDGKQDDLFFVDRDTGFSVNGLGQIFGTRDGGDRWEMLIERPGTYFRAITFVDAMRGFAGNIGTDYYPGVTDTTPLYGTTDAGRTWEPVAIDGPTPVGICNFSRLDDQHLFATGRVGGPSFFLRSSDGGATWTSRDISSEIGMLIDSHFWTPLDGVVIGGTSTSPTSRCTVLRTRDGGETWDSVFRSPRSGEMCWKLSFPSARVGYASVLTFGDTPSSFVRTTDGGETWESLPLVDHPFTGLGVGFLDERIGWIAGGPEGDPGYRTMDGGDTWEPDPSLGARVNRFRFVDGRGYAIGATIHRLDLPE
jgi:photosystem II stability/assembly factor-like uncharacterized protein